MGDVAAKIRVVKGYLIHCRVGFIDSCLYIGTGGCHAQYPARVGAERSVVEGGPGVEDDQIFPAREVL